MRRIISVKVAILSAISIFVFISPSLAFWPTFDGGAIAPAVKNAVQEAQSVKQQIESCKELQKIKTAIGDAKEAASKFNEDVVQKAKQTAEKVKKEAEKVKKVQEDIKKAKAEYEAKKKQFEEYKKQIEETKAAVDSKIKDAKSMVDDAKAATEGAKALASQAITDAKSKVGEVNSTVSGAVRTAQNKVNSATGSSQNTISPAQNQVRTVQPATTGTTVLKTNTNNTPMRVEQRTIRTEPAINTVTGINRGYVAPQVEKIGIIAAPSVGGRRAFTVEAKPEETPDTAATLVPAEDESSEINNPEIEAEVEDIKKIASEQGTGAATRLLKTSIDEAVKNKDVDRLDALSKIETGDIINSNSKKYEETPSVGGRRAFTKPLDELTVEKLKNQEQSVKEGLRPVEINSVKTISPKTLKEEGAPLTLPKATLQKNSFWLEEKKTASQAVKLSFADTLRFATTAGECTKYNNAIQTKDGTVIVIPELLAKECCIEADKLTDLNVIRDCAKGLVRGSQGIPELSDDQKEKNKEECGNAYSNPDNKCEWVADDQVMQEKSGVYGAIIAQQGANVLAEAKIDSAKANEYVKKFFEPYKEQVAKIQSSGAEGASGSSNRDAISLLSLTNQQMMYLFNMIRRTYATSLADISLRGLGGVTVNAVKADEDGISTTVEYDNGVIRQETGLNYPVLPENIAIECNIKAKELGESGSDEISQQDPDITALADCYRKVVAEVNVLDESKRADAENFLQFTQYQEVLNTLEKALYQKVTSAKYEDILEKVEEGNNSATTTRGGNESMFETETEMARILDDLVNVYASKLSYTAIKAMTRLEEETTPTSSTGTEG